MKKFWEVFLCIFIIIICILVLLSYYITGAKLYVKDMVIISGSILLILVMLGLTLYILASQNETNQEDDSQDYFSSLMVRRNEDIINRLSNVNENIDYKKIRLELSSLLSEESETKLEPEEELKIKIDKMLSNVDQNRLEQLKNKSLDELLRSPKKRHKKKKYYKKQD